MIIRRLKSHQYQNFFRFLEQHAHTEPLDASCTVRMAVNAMEYAVKLQPERGCKMAVLQAFEVDRNPDDAPDSQLITSGRVLSALLELMLEPGVCRSVRR